jgi:hypothetical protein
MDMKKNLIILLTICTVLSGCTGDDGPSAYIDEIYVYVDGTLSDETICSGAVVVKSGTYYVCTFTLNSDAWIGIELEVASGSPSVDLITMDELNFDAWEDDDEYYYIVSASDFATSGGSYSSDGNLDAGEWVVVVYNP